MDFDSAGNHCARKATVRVIGGTAPQVDGTETITTVAGTDTVSGNDGDGLPATSAKPNNPWGVAIDASRGTLRHHA